MMGMDQDDIVLAPWTTIKYRVSGNNTGGSSGGDTANSNTATADRRLRTKTLNDLYPGTSSTALSATIEHAS